MSQHWTEAAIRAQLDGTWTRVTYEGRIVTEALEDGEEPPTEKGGKPKGIKNSKAYTVWTPEEDEIIIRERRRNRLFREIAWLISRTEESTKKRYKVLRVNGRVLP